MQLIGRLAAEAELVHTSTGKEIVRYAIGVNHGNRDNQTTSWFRVTSFAEGGSREYLLGLPRG